MTAPRFLASLLLLASTAAAAADFRTVNATSVILYDAPSVKGAKLFVAPRGMPVEVVSAYGEWVKVRDATGDMAWTEAKGLSSRRNLVVRTASARVHAAAEDDAPLVMTADKGVLLELIDPPANGWAHVRHRDGILGWVRAADVWGD